MKAAASGGLEGQQEVGESKANARLPAWQVSVNGFSGAWPTLSQRAGSGSKTSFLPTEISGLHPATTPAWCSGVPAQLSKRESH